MFKRTLSAWSLGGSCLDSPRLVLYSLSVSARMIGLPLTIATTSGPCSRVQPDTPTAIAIRPSRTTERLPYASAENLDAGSISCRRSLRIGHSLRNRSCKSILLGNLLARLISAWGLCSRGRGRRWARDGWLFAFGLQRAIDGLPDLVDRLVRRRSVRR